MLSSVCIFKPIIIILTFFLERLSKEKKKAYIFHISAWTSLREENKIENHMNRPYSRYGESVKKLIWQANRGKKANATRRQVKSFKSRKFPYFSDATREAESV